MAPITITVRSISEGCFPVDVDDDETVEDLEILVFSLKPELGDGLRLVHRGKILKDHQVLRELGIQPGDNVAVAKGGISHKSLVGRTSGVSTQTKPSAITAADTAEPCAATVNATAIPPLGTAIDELGLATFAQEQLPHLNTVPATDAGGGANTRADIEGESAEVDGVAPPDASIASLKLMVTSNVTDTFQVEIDDDDTVEGLATLAYSLRPELGWELQLSHSARILENEQVLRDIGIQSGDTICVAGMVQQNSQAEAVMHRGETGGEAEAAGVCSPPRTAEPHGEEGGMKEADDFTDHPPGKDSEKESLDAGQIGDFTNHSPRRKSGRELLAPLSFPAGGSSGERAAEGSISFAPACLVRDLRAAARCVEDGEVLPSAELTDLLLSAASRLECLEARAANLSKALQIVSSVSMDALRDGRKGESSIATARSHTSEP